MVKEKLKRYAKEFVQDESGMELMQLAVAVVITAGLIGVAITIQKAIKSGLGESAIQLQEGFGEAGIDIELE